MPYKRGFSVKKRFKKEKLDSTKRLQTFIEQDNNNEYVVQVNLRLNSSIYFVQKLQLLCQVLLIVTTTSC